MRILLILVLGVFINSSGVSQNKVNWLTWEEALELHAKEKKKILVDVYTNWCGWCKKMEKTTFSTQNIAEYVNENYYAVKFNAEQKEDIQFKNKTYKYIGTFGRKGYHQLAYEIMNGKMSYPTVVFIDENLDVIQPLAGFQGAEKFEMIMTYFAENFYKAVPWNKFAHAYQNGAIKTKKSAVSPKEIQPQVQTVGGGQ